MGIKFKGPEPNRNSLCPCNSGLKAKYCHLDPGKMAACDRIAFEHMSILIAREQHKRGILSDAQFKLFMKRYNPATTPEPVTSRDVDELLDSVELKRCACGIPISDTETQCVKCKNKS